MAGGLASTFPFGGFEDAPIPSNGDGLQPRSIGLQLSSDGLQPHSDGLQPYSDGLQPK